PTIHGLTLDLYVSLSHRRRMDEDTGRVRTVVPRKVHQCHLPASTLSRLSPPLPEKLANRWLVLRNSQRRVTVMIAEMNVGAGSDQHRDGRLPAIRSCVHQRRPPLPGVEIY